MVEQRLRLDRVLVVLAELVLSCRALDLGLALEELDEFEVALAFLFALLLLGELELLVAHLPELGEVLLLLQLVGLLLVLAVDLQRA